MCWDCFEQHVRQVSAPDSVGKCVDDEGNLLCPECGEIITLRDVAKEAAPKKVFDLLEQLKSNLKIKKAVERELKEQEGRLKQEFDRIMAIKDKDEQDAERLRLDIINDILTLRCPRCKIAFIDYTGCAALTCGCCHAGFCAMCLKDCGGEDVHRHVVQCPENRTRQIFITLVDFNRHHSLRRQNLIHAEIKNLSARVKELLLKRMHIDFADLGIHII